MGSFACPEGGCKHKPSPHVDPFDPNGASCSGHCGKPVINIFGQETCSCMDVCEELGKCCHDKDAMCGGPKPKPVIHKATCYNQCGKNVFTKGNMCAC